MYVALEKSFSPETIPMYVALEKSFSPEMMKGILKVRTQMVDNIYRYFDSNLSESHRVKLYICTLLDPRFNTQVCTDITVMYKVNTVCKTL